MENNRFISINKNVINIDTLRCYRWYTQPWEQGDVSVQEYFIRFEFKNLSDLKYYQIKDGYKHMASELVVGGFTKEEFNKIYEQLDKLLDVKEISY